MTDCWAFKNLTDVAGSWVFVGLISYPGCMCLSNPSECLLLPAHQTCYDDFSV